MARLETIRPMLATLSAEPVDKPGWTFEEKYDGYRLLVYKDGAKVTLLSRNDKDKTQAFPEIAAAVAQLKGKAIVLDGEAVAFDKHHVSRFQFLQRGAHNSTLAVFDCMYLDKRDLRREPQSVRRAVMEEQIRGVKGLFASRVIDGPGPAAYAHAQKRGLEGVIAKDASSPYVEGRSKLWLKWKVHQEEEFVVGGYTQPAGSRTHLGALLLGAYDGTELRFVGKVGTGFTTTTLTELSKAFAPLTRDKSAFVNPPREPDVQYLKPALVAQIAFQEWTADHKLRQPVFLGLRDDKKPKDCLMPTSYRASRLPNTEPADD